MANINRDYLVVLDVKTGNVTAPTMKFMNTDKATSNIYVQLVIKQTIIEVTPIQNATDFVVKANIIKNGNIAKLLVGELVNEVEAIYEFDLPSDCTDLSGDYLLEFVVSAAVDGAEESITSTSTTYTVGKSILTGLDSSIEDSSDYPILQKLIDEVRELQANGGTSSFNFIDDTTTATSKTWSSDKINSQIKEKVNQSDLEVERKRIDSFTSLDKGSTTGDAELIDGRIGADGVTYDNIGGAIRGQYRSLDTKKVTGVGITKIMTITQEDYDYSLKDPNTLYIISDTTGEEGGGGSQTLIPYLKNTGGNSYIDTGYIPTTNSIFELTIRDTNQITNNKYMGNQCYNFHYSGTGWFGSLHGNQYAGAQPTNPSSKHTYKRSSTEFYVDGQLQSTVDAKTQNDQRSLYIFGAHLADGYSTMSSEFIFFELKIYEDDTLVHHYKPRKDSSNVACLYDIVTQQYLYNLGTGTLEYGTELEEG